MSIKETLNLSQKLSIEELFERTLFRGRKLETILMEYEFDSEKFLEDLILYINSRENKDGKRILFYSRYGYMMIGLEERVKEKDLLLFQERFNTVSVKTLVITSFILGIFGIILGGMIVSILS